MWGTGFSHPSIVRHRVMERTAGNREEHLGSLCKEKSVKILINSQSEQISLSWTNKWKIISWDDKKIIFICFLFKILWVSRKYFKCCWNWHWKRGNDRKSSSAISFLFLIQSIISVGKMSSYVSPLFLFEILKLEKMLSKTSVRNVSIVNHYSFPHFQLFVIKMMNSKRLSNF